MKYSLIPLSIVFFIGLVWITLRPISTVYEDDCIALEAEIYSVYAGPSFDIVLVLSGDQRNFYINRGEEQGLSTEELNAKLKGKKIKLWYVDHWSLLNYDKRMCHVSRIEFQDEVLFSEIKDME